MKPFNQVIVRVPQFPFSESIDGCWNALKKSIAISSPDFYDLIKDVEVHQISSLPDRVQTTLLKYLNRARYRCVPFGTFSSVGVTSISKTGGMPLQIRQRRRVHQLPDWKNTGDVQYTFADILHGDYKIFTNSSYYTAGHQIRYVRRVGEQFELAEIEGDTTIDNILACCRKPIKISKLLKQVLNFTQQDSETLLIESLVDCGLLLTELDPNLIGQDYFQRIGYQEQKNGAAYLISEHVFDECGIDHQYIQHIPALIDRLTDILPEPEESADLTEFMHRFSKRFERRDVPVMIALDPELGVGYGALHKNADPDSLCSKVIGSQSKRHENAQAQFFHQLGGFRVGETVHLDKLMDHNSASKRTRALPNSSALIASIVDGLLIVERIGGHSFNQLAGRFTAVSEAIRGICREITAIEEKANLEVIFFDIAYSAEIAVDNVNRRQRLYGQELNLLNYTELEDPLTLEDLYVSVSGREIVLRSKRLNKRMVPRMASAYNYRRSDLPVFRFLYDLSFYGIWPDLTFDPGTLFPDKQYYPRFQFRNIVLSLARIKVTKQDIVKGDLNDQLRGLDKLLAYFQLGNFVKVLSGEEPLVIDCTNQQDMVWLLRTLRKRGSLYVEEYPLPTEPLIVDKQGKGYLNQLIVPLIHQKQVYYGSGSIADIPDSTTRTFLPGNDWISLEIFGHPAGADAILTGSLLEVIHQFGEQIKCWFFVRYNENGEHLRFRLQLIHKTHRDAIMDMIHTRLEPLSRQGLLSDLSIRTYYREMERYDIAGIDRVEQHFKTDSELVLGMIGMGIPEDQRYIHCLQLLLAVRDANVIGDQRFISWMENIRDHLSHEHEMDIQKYKEINRHYREKGVFIQVKQHPMLPGAAGLAKSFVQLITLCAVDRRRAPLFTDLMHMHINRLFADHQRAHEMIIYNLLIPCLKQSQYCPQ